MKLTSVELRPKGSTSFCVLSFRDPKRVNSYNVKAIDGLDAEAITPRYYGAFGTSKFYNLMLERRDINIRIELNPNFTLNETYSGLRDALYKMIASSRTGQMQIQFKNGTEVLGVISGFVSKVEAPNFDRMQEVRITVKCDEPMLKALTPVNVTVAGLLPSNTTIDDIKSTAPHGFKFTLNITAARASVIIDDPVKTDIDWNFTVTPVGGFLNGDVLHFSSEYNNKYLYLVRGATTIHLGDVIAAGSIWPILFPGINTIRFLSSTGMAWATISYYPTYWGV